MIPEKIDPKATENRSRVIFNLNIGAQLIAHIGTTKYNDMDTIAVHIEGPIRKKPDEFHNEKQKEARDEFMQIMDMIENTIDTAIGYEYVLSIVIDPAYVPDDARSHQTMVIPCRSTEKLHFHVIPIDPITKDIDRDLFVERMLDNDQVDLSEILTEHLYHIYEPLLLKDREDGT